MLAIYAEARGLGGAAEPGAGGFVRRAAELLACACPRCCTRIRNNVIYAALARTSTR